MRRRWTSPAFESHEADIDFPERNSPRAKASERGHRLSAPKLAEARQCTENRDGKPLANARDRSHHRRTGRMNISANVRRGDAELAGT